MNKLFILTLLFFGFLSHAQLVFKNRDSKGALPQFIIKNGDTEIYGKLGGKINLLEVFDQVPELYDNRDGKSRYKMTKTTSDNVARRTYEISYTLYRQTQKYTANIKYTIDFHDKRATKVFNEYFDII